MKLFKTRARKFGGHWDVTVFVAAPPYSTYANCGTLTMSTTDYESFREKFNADHIIEGEK